MEPGPHLWCPRQVLLSGEEREGSAHSQGNSPLLVESTPPPTPAAWATHPGSALAHLPATFCWVQRGTVFSPLGRAILGPQFCQPSLPVALDWESPPAAAQAPPRHPLGRKRREEGRACLYSRENLVSSRLLCSHLNSSGQLPSAMQVSTRRFPSRCTCVRTGSVLK